jgi:hypothetical protein
MRIGVFVLAFAAVGCYQYSTTGASEVRSPQQVRVELTDAGTANIVPKLGASVQFIEGHVVQASEAGLTLSVDQMRRKGEPLFKQWTGDSVQLASGDIRLVRLRTQNRSRTTIAAVGAGAAAIALVVFAATADGLFGGSTKRVPPAIR